MSKTSILRSIKAGRISAGRDEFSQWAIEPCELHRVYPAPTHDTGTGNRTGERPVTGSETALAEANARAAVAEARLSDFKLMLDDIREQRDRWQQQAERRHSRSRISASNRRQRSLSRGGPGYEPRRVTSCCFGLWASYVGAFCSPLCTACLDRRSARTGSDTAPGCF